MTRNAAKTANAALRLGVIVLCLLGGSAALAAPSAVHPIDGDWVTEAKDSVVRIGDCGARKCGRILKILPAGANKPKTDVNNPDKAMQSRPIIGLPVLTNFQSDGSKWVGKIYDPRVGKTYKSKAQVAANGTLKVEGCILFLCQAETWTRAGE